MSSALLTPEQEAQVEKLADKIQEANRPLVLKLARLLLSKKESELFGQTEFDVRDLVHLTGAQAYETFLAEKKTATRDRARPAPPVDRRPSSRITGKKRRSAY